ncbi:MAG: DNA polymerase I [Clostridia bacterium]|nr:DNA polymerase I [Clostridia bacterium]
MKKLLILDGNSIINRAFYGVRNLTNSKGMPTNALFGFTNIVKRYTDMLKPDFSVCTFDMHHPTFRHKKYEGYKCNRKGMPDELAVQMPYAKKIVSYLGFTVLETPGYEADDIIGTVCGAADTRGDIDSYILTGDRDSLQLISHRTRVILMRNKEDEIFDREHFFDVYGVTPEQFVDVKALMGDSSDCIPGVPGIGEKTALKLIALAGGLDLLYADSENGYFSSTPSVRRKLDEGKASAYLSRELAEICRCAPIGQSIEEYVTGTLDKSGLYKTFLELDFTNLINKFRLSAADLESGDETQKESIEYKVKSVTAAEMAELSLQDTVAVWLKDSMLCVFDGSINYVCRNADRASLLNVFSKRIICHDYKQICKKLTSYSIRPECNFDTMLARYLTEPGKSVYTLKYTAESLGVDFDENEENYAQIVHICYEKLFEELKATGSLSLLSDIEIPLAAVLADIESVGFKVDRQGIKNYACELLKMENELASSIYMLAGHDFNINSPKQLGCVLFEELMLPSGKKTKTGYSTDAETLKKLRFHHPIISEILSYRQVAKLRGTYGDALADIADENDRIHTSLNQCGTATGRLSSNDPNLQNIPIRGELGREIRKFFTASDDEHVLIDADYSQIELRLLAHLSGDNNMISSFNSGADIHTMTAAKVFRVSPENVTKDLRLRAKAVNFGIIYGIGSFSLSQDIGCSRKQADAYINSYFETYPLVDKYLKDTVSDAERNGYTVTMFGRMRMIPEIKSSNKNVAAFGKRVAMNSPIQGAAADIIKIAMIRVARSLKEAGIDARLIMQVHDELIVESHTSCADTAREILVREMENAVKLKVSLIAEAGVGATWFDAH